MIGSHWEIARRKEGKEYESWLWEVLYKLCCLPSKFINKYSIICTVGRGQSQQRAKSGNVVKENIGYFRHSCLGTDNHSSSREKAWLPETEILTLTRLYPSLAPASEWTLPSLNLDKDTELTSSLFLHYSLWDSPWVALASNSVHEF